MMAEHPEWVKAQVVHCNAGLWRRDGYSWRGIGHTGGRSPLPSLLTSRSGPVTVVIDEWGNLACDLDAISVLDGDARELLTPKYLPRR